MEMTRRIPGANFEFAAFFDQPETCGEQVASGLRDILPDQDVEEGYSFTVVIPFEAVNTPATCVETCGLPQSIVDALVGVVNTANSRAEIDAFVSSRQQGLAKGLGVSADKLIVLRRFNVIRIKSGRRGVTRAHSDYYSYMFLNDTLATLSKHRYGLEDCCSGCGGPISPVTQKSVIADDGVTEMRIRSPRVCEGCGARPLKIFTIWSCLHDAVPTVGGLLDTSITPLEIDPFKVQPSEIWNEWPAGFTGEVDWQSFGGPTVVKAGQGCVFTPRMPHRRLPGDQVAKITHDVRFALV